jgi:hypothetical protein
MSISKYTARAPIFACRMTALNVQADKQPANRADEGADDPGE